MKSLASSVSKIAAPVLGKRGLGEAQIVTEWAAIVGEDLARQTIPVKLAFGTGSRQNGTLHLRVASGAAPEVQHREPQIVERINGFAGYHMVGRLALSQGPIPAAKARPQPPPPPLALAEAAALDARLVAVGDPGLKAALRRLGEAVIGREAMTASVTTDPTRRRSAAGLRPRRKTDNL
jgi:hypothetical protein